MTIKIGQIPADNVDQVWESVSPGLQHVLDMYDNRYTLEHVKQQIKMGYWWLVVVTEDSKLIGTFTCSPVEYADYTVLMVQMGVGEPMSHWRDIAIEFMKEGARKIGASFIEWRGRKGFMKAFSDVAKVKHVSMVIPVEK